MIRSVVTSAQDLPQTVQHGRWLLAIAALTSIVLIATAHATPESDSSRPPAAVEAGAHGPPGLPLPGLVPPGALADVVKRLDLTPETQQRIQQIFQETMPRFETLHAELRRNAEDLLHASPASPVYEQTLTHAARESGRIVTELVREAGKIRGQVFNAIPSAQQGRFMQLEATAREPWLRAGPGHSHSTLGQ